MPRSLPTLQDACAAIAAQVQRLEPEEVALESALGRITAAPVEAVEPLPGFDNSAMDGYAVRARDTRDAPLELAVGGEARAGRPSPRALGAMEAMPISTGACLPDGADAVVRREHVEQGTNGFVGVTAAVTPGRDVRRAGEEVNGGDVLIAGGVRMGAVELGALAAAGVATVACHRVPRVAVLVTGDELNPIGQNLEPGGVRDSNRVMLEALVASCGGRVVSSSRAPDDEAAITSAAAAALAGADLLITCGGMSVGPHDHVRTALAAAGVEPVFAGVALAPGRPAGFGMGLGGRPVFGLPGNPLSALVAFRLLVEPALDRLAARDEDDRRTVTVKASHGFPGRDGVTAAVPCRIDAQGAAPMPVTGHGPTAALGADGLALVAPGRAGAAQGEAVTVALLHTPSPWVVSMACVCS